MNKNGLNATENDHQVIHSWWQWLDDNRGDRAKLRRATCADEIMMMEPFFHFLNFRGKDSGKLSKIWEEPEHMHVAAMVCGLLARVKRISEEEIQTEQLNEQENELKKYKKLATFAEQLACPNSGGNSPIMSEIRFQKLQKSESYEDFYTNMCRAIDLLNGKVNISSMLEDILLWYQEFQSGMDKEPRNRLAVRWATAYFTTLQHYKLA